ncbi:MAG: SDR family oxidoreductase [Bacilli bacterium]|nr:SDR family oxidoreductase [Bacilli bacterium]
MYVLITGASSGIGLELARLYSQNGYDLILVARSVEKLNDLKKELKTSSNDIVVKAFDLSSPDQCNQLFDEVKSLNISVFINNAGYGYLGHFSDTDINLERNMLDLNIIAVQILTKLFIQHYEKGTVVNVSSMAAFLPTPTFATYAASKSYVHQLSRAVNYELKKKKKNIRVLTVTPGPVKTKFNERANANINRGMDVTKCAKIIFRGIQKQKELIVPGFSMKVLRIIVPLIPTKILLRFAYRIQNSK